MTDLKAAQGIPKIISDQIRHFWLQNAGGKIYPFGLNFRGQVNAILNFNLSREGSQLDVLLLSYRDENK